MRKSLVIAITLMMISIHASAYDDTVVKVYKKDFTTYRYSAPDPIPVFGKIYPYYKFRDFSTKPEKVDWTVVELENELLIVRILPEIGGKICSVTDKVSGKEVFYGNDVVKFRNVALRGPWTSGGIEFNFGVIGHSPSCASPVNYLTRTNPDGSASCFLSDLDLVTRTRWSIEINLPKDKAFFSIRSFWHNKTASEAPYYHWTNAAVKTEKDLEFVFPGDHLIGHDGIPALWPEDTVRHKKLSQWSQNDFESSKSYHIVGARECWFGAYRHDDDFGVVKYSLRDDKLGGKIWIWALSDEGEIWTDFLTDDNGQYAEIQSGRLFNQNLPESSMTPFKQIGFQPYGTDTWVEYWFPFGGTGGVSSVSTAGVFNVMDKGRTLDIAIYPLADIADTLMLYDQSGRAIIRKPLSLRAAHLQLCQITITDDMNVSKISFRNEDIWTKEKKSLSRPLTVANGFDADSPYGCYLRGRDYREFGLYDKAEALIRKSLAADSCFVPSLVEMSRLQYRHMDYESAFSYARKALSIDTYDAAANYEYGRAALKLNDTDDALDGFETASLTSAYRSAAYTEIGKIYMRRNNFEKALTYAQKSLVNNQYNIEGLQLLYLASLFTGRVQEAANTADRLAELDPMNVFIRFENYYKDKNTKSPTEFWGLLKEESPVQTGLELAVWYYSVNCIERSLAVLKSGPQNAMTYYWRAFLERDDSNEEQAESMLDLAAKQDAYLIFPFREESKEVLVWAVGRQQAWQPRYYLALLESSRGNRRRAYDCISDIEQEVGFAPFYSLRAMLNDDAADREKDLITALRVSGNGAEYVLNLARHYYNRADYAKSAKTLAPYYKNDFGIGLQYVRALLEIKDYRTAEQVLDQIEVLPSEGNNDSRQLYRRTKLSLAIQAIAKGDKKTAGKKIAESRLWPRNIGVGKPYDELTDTAIEDALTEIISKRSYDSDSLNALMQSVEKIGREEHTSMF